MRDALFTLLAGLCAAGMVLGLCYFAVVLWTLELAQQVTP